MCSYNYNMYRYLKFFFVYRHIFDFFINLPPQLLKFIVFLIT